MGFKTLSGALPAEVAASGVQEVISGVALSAANMNETYRDLQAAGIYSMLSGVLSGGVCTAAGLSVTVPNGTIYLARTVWISDSSVAIAVPDASTSYIWACADGQLRITSTTTPPTGWDARTACILVKATSTGGTATLDLAVQQKARYADTVNRKIIEQNAVDVSAGLILPMLTADPAAPVTGQAWYRTDTHQICVREAGATKRSAALT